MIGMAAGILTTFAFFPQVLKTVKSKSTDDLSWTWLVMMIAGVALWMVYGIYIHSISLILSNAVTLCSVCALFSVKYINYDRIRKNSN
ncbi:MAG: SemiSWEET transporter [Sporomusaceae bacterium]|nr:SemiSWEET transporter [Sporomusaceae bacterium]